MSQKLSSSVDINTDKHWALLVNITHGRAWWLITTAVTMALVLGLTFLNVIRLLALPLAVFIFGFTLAAALAPLVSILERRIPRVAATLRVYLILAVFIGFLIWFIVPSLVTQVQDLVSILPGLFDQIRQLINTLRGNFAGDTFANTVLTQLSKLGPTLLSLPLGITSTLAMVVLILFISFYLLLEAPGIWISLLSLMPEARRAKINQTGSDMSQAMGGYIRGTVINGLIVGGIIIVSLTLLQSPSKALWVLIFWIILEQTENHILVPNIMRSQTNISPLMSILALFAGGAVGGFLGALVAIPIAAALRILFRQMIAPAIRERTGAESVKEEEKT